MSVARPPLRQRSADTLRRSVTKSISYRVLGSGATIGISLLVTGQSTAAISIGGWDTLALIVAYFLHERIWIWFERRRAPFVPSSQPSSTPLQRHSETIRVSLMKTLSYRIVATSITIEVCYLITGSTQVAFSIGAIDCAAKVVEYYLHERLWIWIDVRMAQRKLSPPARESG